MYQRLWVFRYWVLGFHKAVLLGRTNGILMFFTIEVTLFAKNKAYYFTAVLWIRNTKYGK